MKYNHMFDVAFSIVTSEEDPDRIRVGELILALEKRIASLKANPADAADAFGFSDTYEVE